MVETIDTLIDIIDLPTPATMEKYGLIPGSSSAVGTMENCTLQYDGKYGVTMKKIPFVQNEGALYGDHAHKAIELNLFEEKPIPIRFIKELPNLQHKVDWVKNHEGFSEKSIEAKLAINTEGSTEWKGRAIGVIGDVVLYPSDKLAWYIDWKTIGLKNWRGMPKKPKPDFIQAELTALIMFMQNPMLRKLVVLFEFLRHDLRSVIIFDRSSMQYQVTNPDKSVSTRNFDIHNILSRYWAIQRSKKFRPSPSGLCPWCDVVTCDHWKPQPLSQA